MDWDLKAWESQHQIWTEDHKRIMHEIEIAERERQANANTITCMAAGQEMLRVGPDGFWVRGVRVEQDEGEARAVYAAFKQWMMWAQLNREYV